MRLAIADPPYLGRAQRWYGSGRGQVAADHSRAVTAGSPSLIQTPESGTTLRPTSSRSVNSSRDYEGWALAAAADSLPVLLPAAPADVVVGVWHRPNAMPGGGRMLRSWEPVLFYIPTKRRHRRSGLVTRDVLSAAVRPKGFLGAKPTEWTRWVLAVLGYDPGLDELDDLFPGSGAVSAAADGLLALPAPEPSTLDAGADNVITLRPHT